jgi:hypothetical protein
MSSSLPLRRIRPAVKATALEGERSSKNPAFVDAVARKNVELTMAQILEQSAVLSQLQSKGASKSPAPRTTSKRRPWNSSLELVKTARSRAASQPMCCPDWWALERYVRSLNKEMRDDSGRHLDGPWRWLSSCLRSSFSSPGRPPRHDNRLPRPRPSYTVVETEGSVP